MQSTAAAFWRVGWARARTPAPGSAPRTWTTERSGPALAPVGPLCAPGRRCQHVFVGGHDVPPALGSAGHWSMLAPRQTHGAVLPKQDLCRVLRHHVRRNLLYRGLCLFGFVELRVT